MAVETSGAKFVNFTNGSGIVAPVPVGLLAGDIWVVACTNDNQDSSGYITPAGWTKAGTATLSSFDGQHTVVYYKTATASETETSFNTGALGQSGVLVSLRVSGSTGLDSVGQTTQSAASNTVPMDGATVTTTQAGDFILFLGSTDYNNTAAPTFVAPTGYAGLTSQGNSSFSSLVIATTTVGAAGTYTSAGASATYPTAGTTGATATYLLAFKAAATSPSIGPGTKGRKAAGSGPITVSVTVTSSGNGVLVGTTHIDNTVYTAASVTGIPGATFEKVAAGTPVAENGFQDYVGAPSIWVARNVPAGSYTLSVNIDGNTDTYGSAVAQEIGPTSTSVITKVNDGLSATPWTGNIDVPENSLTVSLVAFSPGGNIGFAAPQSGWTRQGVEDDNQNFTGLVLDSNRQSSAGTISETFPNAQNSSAPWSVVSVTFTSPASGGTSRRPLVLVNGQLAELPVGDSVTSGGTSIHGALMGLSADDHTQYHNDARGDVRYAALTHALSPSAIAKNGALGGQAIQWNGAAWVVNFQPTLGQALSAVQQSNQSISGTTLTDIANLVIGLEANAVYAIECDVTFQSSATGNGLTLAISTPSGCRNMVEMTVPISSTAAASQLRTIFPNAAVAINGGSITGTGVTAANSNHTARITGILRNGSTQGDCQLKAAASTAGGTVTIMAGSEMNIWRLA